MGAASGEFLGPGPDAETSPEIRRLAEIARRAARAMDAAPHHRTAGHRSAAGDPYAEVAVLADRPDGTVIRYGEIVAKAHAPGTARDTGVAADEPAALAARLRVAAHPRAAGVLLPPLTAEPGTLPGGPPAEPLGDSGAVGQAGSGSAVAGQAGGRAVTLWPYGSPVSPDHPEAAPWEAAGRLLAGLHTLDPARLPGPLPVMRGPAKAARAVARLRAAAPGAPATAAVLGAWAGLPAWARDQAPMPRADVVCHGDLHLGQLVRHPAPDGPWLLIDVDDLGIGEPAWDLGRPAAWYATGLLTGAEWTRFLDAYRAAGGPAVRAEGDPWPELDEPARALTVQAAATAVAKATAAGRELDEAEEAMVDACARIARLGAPVVG